MIGIVAVSHSQQLAEGVIHLASQMAHGVPMEPAGGLDDGSFGTSYEKIMEAIEKVGEQAEDGVLVTVDLGSGVMTTEMVIEDLDDDLVQMADCPMVEGTFAAAVNASSETDILKLKEIAQNTWNFRKIQSEE